MSKEYHIYLDHNIAVDGEQTGGQLSETSSPEKSAKKQQSEAKTGAAAKLVGVYIGKQAFQWATSNYGNMTGDYIGQQWISEGIEIAGLTVAALKSPTGVAVAGAVLAKKAIDKAVEVQKSRQNAQQLRERGGGTVSSGGRR